VTAASPYARLVQLALREAGLVAAGRLDELAAIHHERDELTASLPATPPASARPDLEQAQRIVGETERALHAQLASVGHALRRLGDGRRAVLAYTQA
jgi:hypothetical protein